MRYKDFNAELDKLESPAAAKREISKCLDTIDRNPEFVREYVHEHSNASSVRFLSSLISVACVTIRPDDVLILATHLRAESRSEDSDLYSALRVAVGEDVDVILRLFQTLIANAEPNAIQSSLLFVFPEVKLHSPTLFLDCVKRCAQFAGSDPLAGVLSSVICDLPPEKDANTAKYVRDGLTVFNDEIWLEKVSDDRLLDIAGCLFALASILLDVLLIQSVLAFIRRSFAHRESNALLVRVLAIPYTIWREETDELLPDLRRVYETEGRLLDPDTALCSAWKQLRKVVFEEEQHFKRKIHLRIAAKQQWRRYRTFRQRGEEGKM